MNPDRSKKINHLISISLKQKMIRIQNVQILWWGFSTFRFKRSEYLPGMLIFVSYDFGPIEIRILKHGPRFKRPTAAPLTAAIRKAEDRMRKKRKIEPPSPDPDSERG